MNSGAVPPDVQSSKPVYSIPIDRVGVKGVYRRVCIGSSRGSTCLDAYIDVMIDLPKNQRGIHVSRNIEAALDVFSSIEYGGFASLEEAIENLCRELLAKHGYATNAEARLSTTFIYEYGDTNLELKEHIPVKISMRSRVSRGSSDVHRRLCIEVVGMTVCPCALQMCSYTLNTVGYAPSHTQRAKLRMCVSTVNSFIDAADLIEIALNSFSTPVFSYLKRDKECRMILRGFENAKFAEDVVRSALHGLYRKFAGRTAPDTAIDISLRSYESIHPFDLFVSTRCRMGELAEHFSSG